MSIFNKIFGDSDSKGTPQNRINWTQLTQLKQLDEAVQVSNSQIVVFFKHSTRCSISRMALKQFESHYKLSEEEVKPYFLDLLSHRDISNAIAERFGVEHQSPQLIAIKDGKCIYTVSHSDIDAEELQVRVAEAN